MMGFVVGWQVQLTVLLLFSVCHLNDARPSSCQYGYYYEPYRGCIECMPCARPSRPEHIGDKPDGFIQECWDHGSSCPNYCVRTRYEVSAEREYSEMCRSNFTFNPRHSHTRTFEPECEDYNDNCPSGQYCFQQRCSDCLPCPNRFYSNGNIYSSINKCYDGGRSCPRWCMLTRNYDRTISTYGTFDNCPNDEISTTDTTIDTTIYTTTDTVTDIATDTATLYQQDEYEEDNQTYTVIDSEVQSVTYA